YRFRRGRSLSERTIYKAEIIGGTVRSVSRIASLLSCNGSAPPHSTIFRSGAAIFLPDFPGRVSLRPMNARTTPPQGADRDRRTAEGMLLLTAFIWGGTFGATKLLLGGSLEPMGLLTWRFGIASVFFLLLYFSRIRRMMTPRALAVGL